VSTIWYTTRERVKRALDSAETARNNAQVDAAIAAATPQIEGLTHRVFYPWTGTRYFDNDAFEHVVGTRLWLGRHDLVSVTSITVDGTALAASDYHLLPQDGPPYTRIDLDDDASVSWSAEQRGNTIVGVWGFGADTTPAGALDAAVATTTITTISVTDSALVGIGDIIAVDSERMIVTGKTMADTGVNIDAGDSLAALASDVSITLSAAPGAPTVDETILIGSERMLVVDVAGLVCTVKRAWDGSVLATHAGSTDIYAPRTLTVTRGALGTTAATHLDAAAITRHVPAPLVPALATAESMNTLLNEGSGYARVAGQGDNAREYWGRALGSLRQQVLAAYGRKARSGAI
jgi:hypothetical protein